MLAEIITIGDEILIGQIIDTNSAWLGQKLNEIGIDVTQISSVPDLKPRILDALKEAESRADLIIITGGLGPTKDDITKHTLCEYFNTNLVRNEEVLDRLATWFKGRGRPMTILNETQADLPENCTILPNMLGTASGMWFEQNNTIYVSLPGVPYEMKGLMESQVLPKLVELGTGTQVEHHTFLTAGIPESFLAELIRDFENELPEHIKLAYLPKPGMVRLRLTARGPKGAPLKEELEALAVKLRPQISEYLYGEGDKPFTLAIGELLMEKEGTVALAESCTGGLLAHMFTKVAGCSRYFEGSVVVYSYELKEKLLGVNHDTLVKYGAVSEQTVIEMAEGAKKALNVKYAVSISGTAGPDGGTPEKPVGTVWIAVSGPNGTKTYLGQHGNSRMPNIERAAAHALYMLWRELKFGEA